MSKVLVIAEFSRGALCRSTLSAITAARMVVGVLGGRFSVLLLGTNVGHAAQDLVHYGAERVLVCDHDALENYTAETYAASVVGAASLSEVIIGTASRVRCGSCGDEHLVGFSCKRRGVCPSCTSRRARRPRARRRPRRAARSARRWRQQVPTAAITCRTQLRRSSRSRFARAKRTAPRSPSRLAA